MKIKLLFGLALLAGTFASAQCDIVVGSTTVCVTDPPQPLNVSVCGEATFSGTGVTDGLFFPAEAGIGTHTITASVEGGQYSVEEGVFDPIDISIEGTDVSLGDDQVSGALPIGFDFTFFENTFSEFYISSNGFMTFTSTSDNGCCTGQELPTTAEAANMIAFSWEDLDPGNGGQPEINVIRYATVGSAPNRILVMEFFNVDHFSAGNNVTTEVMLYETTNVIEIHTTAQPGDGGGNEHTMGIQNQDRTIAYTVPGRNGTDWTAFNDMWRFCPSVPCISSIDITVTEAPDVSVAASVSEICEGEEVTLSVTGTAESYSFGPGIENGVPFVPTSTGPTVFVVGGVGAGGCIASSTVSVMIHPIPFVDAGPDTVVCENSAYLMTGITDAPDVTFTWDMGVTDGETITQPAGIITYTVTGTNAGGCQASSSVTIESIDAPTGTGVVTMVTGAAFDGAIDFTPSGGTGGSYEFLWSNTATTEDISALTTGEYTVNVSDGFCASDVTFTVDSQASIEGNELKDLSVYPNPFADAFAIEYDGTYNWTVFDNAGKIIATGQAFGKEMVSLEKLAAGNYIVKVESEGKSATVSLVKE